MTHTEQYIINKYKMPALANKSRSKWKELNNFILQLGGNRTDKICIFCSGERGRKLYWNLKKRLIQVDYFSDNNEGAQGYVFDNIYCVAKDIIKRDSERILVFVALAEGANEVVAELKNDGLLYVEDAQILDEWFRVVPEVAWLSEVDRYNIDYSEQAILALIDEYRNMIFDMCKYYEERN